MTTATAEPLTREDIDQFLSRLSDDQKKTVLVKLAAPLFASSHTAVVYDEQGKLLGDLVPAQPVQPGQKIGMTDEEREALAKVPRVTRLSWRPIRTANATRHAE